MLAIRWHGHNSRTQFPDTGKLFVKLEGGSKEEIILDTSERRFRPFLDYYYGWVTSLLGLFSRGSQLFAVQQLDSDLLVISGARVTPLPLWLIELIKHSPRCGFSP